MLVLVTRATAGGGGSVANVGTSDGGSAATVAVAADAGVALALLVLGAVSVEGAVDGVSVEAMVKSVIDQ